MSPITIFYMMIEVKWIFCSLFRRLNSLIIHFLPSLPVSNINMDKYKQLESTFDQGDEYSIPTASIAMLANAQLTNPLNVKFTVIQNSVKYELNILLSNPQGFFSGIYINSFMVIIQYSKSLKMAPCVYLGIYEVNYQFINFLHNYSV